MSILKPKGYLKPYKYDWAYRAFELQNKMHWIKDEVPMHEDEKDWDSKLTDNERNLLTQLFRFFTQADVDIASGYLDKYIPAIENEEVRMMMASFAAMEGVHVDAYSVLLDTVGMPESEYKAFQAYQEMRDKHSYFSNTSSFYYFDVASEEEILDIKSFLRTLAIYSAFGEGLQLFSSFAILLNFPRFNKMKGMGQIVTWSVRDESLHVDSMIKVFHELIKEHPHIWTDDFRGELYQACRDMVDLEDKFIDLAFSLGGIEGLTKEEVKQYIRYIADQRLLQLGCKKNYNIDKNPLEWLDWVLNGLEHTNFFENRVTNYSKGALSGSWKDVWSTYESKE